MLLGMDGGTLARLIGVERPEIKIIIISGYSEEVARSDIVDVQNLLSAQVLQPQPAR